MSVRFVACVPRYSRGAKNRCGLKYNTGFITIFLRCIIAKNYPNWPRIDKVIAKIKRVQFFLKQCRIQQWPEFISSAISSPCHLAATVLPSFLYTVA